MGHMQPQVRFDRWYIVETTHGTVCVASDDVHNRGVLLSRVHIAGLLRQYCEGTVLSWEVKDGFGARISAPGYMDCTEWDVFPGRGSDQKAETEAWAYLVENYPDVFTFAHDDHSIWRYCGSSAEARALRDAIQSVHGQRVEISDGTFLSVFSVDENDPAAEGMVKQAIEALELGGFTTEEV
jgi:hypothetical protein